MLEELDWTNGIQYKQCTVGNQSFSHKYIHRESQIDKDSNSYTQTYTEVYWGWYKVKYYNTKHISNIISIWEWYPISLITKRTRLTLTMLNLNHTVMHTAIYCLYTTTAHASHIKRPWHICWTHAWLSYNCNTAQTTTQSTHETVQSQARPRPRPRQRRQLGNCLTWDLHHYLLGAVGCLVGVTFGHQTHPIGEALL